MSEKRLLLAQPSQTKKSLVDTLVMMKKSGRLEEGTTRRELQDASEHHSKQNTTYGTVVQKLKLGVKGLEYPDICNPFALLVYLASISSAFNSLMLKLVTAAGDHPLRIVIYMDEMCPGNPFRPEKSRTL